MKRPVTDREFRYIERTVKWTVITGLWALVGLALLGIGSLVRLAF